MRGTTKLSRVAIALGAVACQSFTDAPGAGVPRYPAPGGSAAGAPAAVVLEDLGTFDDDHAHATGINASGAVTGHRFPTGGGPGRAYAWSRSRGMQDLGTLAGGWSVTPGAINARGDVAGIAGRGAAFATGVAFLWSEQDGMRDLFPVTPPQTSAHAINSRGDVAGTIGNTAFVAGHPNAFLWSERDGITLIGDLPGGVGGGTVGRDVNAMGMVVGEASLDGFIHGYVWSRRNGIRDLGLLGPIPSNAGPNAINEIGHIAGTRVPIPPGPGQNSRAFFWTEAGGITELLPPGALRSIAFDVNDQDEVVGTYVSQLGPGAPVHAFYWSARTGFVVLPELAARNTQAVAINNAGDIAGWSVAPDGRDHAVIWHVNRGGM